MTVQIINSLIRPLDGKNHESGIHISGETLQGFRYCIKGDNTTRTWWFLKQSKADSDDMEDLQPDEVFAILDQLINQNPDLKKELSDIRLGYTLQVARERQEVSKLLNQSIINQTEPVTRLDEYIDPQTGDKIYTGILKGPLFYQMIFAKDGTKTFLKSAKKDISDAKSGTQEEALFILEQISRYNPAQNKLIQKLITEIKNNNESNQPNIKLIRYNGVSYINGKNAQNGTQITGETNQFYFQVQFIQGKEIAFYKSKTRQMRNVTPMTVPEITTLLPQIMAKEKNQKIITNLDVILQGYQNPVNYDTEQLNPDLMVTDLTDKTEVLTHPVRKILNSETNEQEYIGFLKGHIFYRLYFSLSDITAHKATNSEMTDAVPCSRKEVRFILTNARKKSHGTQYENTYTSMLKYIEDFWAEEDKEQQNKIIQEVFQENPLTVLSAAEIIAPFKTLPPVLYTDSNGKRHLTWMQDGTIHHIAPDNSIPAFVTLNNGYKRMNATALAQLLAEMDDATPEIQTFAEQLSIQYGKTQNRPLKKFNWEKRLAEDIFQLTTVLPIADIQAKCAANAYPQLNEYDLADNVKKRIASQNTPVSIVLRQRLQAVHEKK